MPSMQVINEKAITMSEVKKELEKIKKRDKELAYRANRTEEYLNFFVHKDSEKLVDALKKLDMARLKDEHIIKIADTMPRDVEDLKSILQGYTITITKDNMNKIVEEVKKFL